MKVIFVLVALIGTSAFAGRPVNTDYTTGDKILFQKDSTWVSIFNKTLCRDEAQFKAVIKKCVSYSNSEESNCTQQVAVLANQPINSTVERCVAYIGREGNGCAKWETVPFAQSPVMTVNYYNSHDQLVGSEEMTVPACSK